MVGFLGYGVSLTLFVLGLRHLGTARTGAYFSLAPFIGAMLAVVLLGDAAVGEAAGGRRPDGAWGFGCIWLSATSTSTCTRRSSMSIATGTTSTIGTTHAPGDPPGEPHTPLAPPHAVWRTGTRTIPTCTTGLVAEHHVVLSPACSRSGQAGCAETRRSRIRTSASWTSSSEWARSCAAEPKVQANLRDGFSYRSGGTDMATRIGLYGAAGHMGRTLIRAISEVL